MKAIFLLFCLGLFNPVFAEELTGLSGGLKPDDPTPMPEQRKWKDQEPLERNYVQQPPLIPHTIDNYEVNVKVNKCLTCHSWANYKQNKATKLSTTHFTNRDGIDLATVSGRRYFCMQCHVPQTDAKPLVENTFKPIQSLQPQ